jgi:HSP20 family protein
MNTTCSPRTYTPATSGVTESLRKPLYNVNGSTDAYEVRVEMPGVPKTGVKLDLEENILTVRGERNATVPEGMKSPPSRTLAAQLPPPPAPQHAGG